MEYYLFQKSLGFWALEKNLGAAKFWRWNKILGAERISGLGVRNSAGRWGNSGAGEILALGKFWRWGNSGAGKILGAGNILGAGKILGAGNVLGAGKILGAGNILGAGKIISG